MATGATEFIDSTTADVFIPEVWSPLAIVARESALVFAKLVDVRYMKGLKYGDIINVPTGGNLAARSKAKATNAAITFETITETNTQITIATWEYAAIAVESIVNVQANRDLLEFYAGKLGYALGLAYDDALAALPDDFTQTVGVLAVENSDNELIRSRQYLDDADAPRTERYFVFSPAAEGGLLKLQRFVSNDYTALHGSGAPATLLESAYMTTFYRIPIYVSVNVEGTNAAGHDNTLFHREAIAGAMQMSPTARHMYDIDYLVDKVAVEQISGVREMRDSHGVWIQGA